MPETPVPPEAVEAAIDAIMAIRNLKSDGSRQWAEPIARAAIEAAAPAVRADERERLSGSIHELVFTDREARPAKWRTRCGRTDVPLERAMSPAPGSYYEVTCPACIRVAELESLLDEILATFHPSMTPNAARSLVPASKLATWRAVRNVGARAVAAADELTRLGEELEDGEPR